MAAQTTKTDNILLDVKGLQKYFPIHKGFLRKVVGNVKAVDDVTFFVRQGETLGLVGESGCGKTTAGRTILRLYEPTGGEVWFKSRLLAGDAEEKLINLAGLDRGEMKLVRREIAMIFQDPINSLNPRMTVGDIIAEPMVIHGRAVDPILRVSLFRSRQISLASFLAMGAGLGEAAVVFVPSLLVAAFAVSESRASYMLLPAVLAMAVSSPLAGRGLDRSGSRLVVLTGSILLALGMILVGWLNITMLSFYVAAILVGLGLGILLGAPLRYIMLNEAPVTDRAAAQGALTLFSSTGQLIGGAMVGAVAASFGGGIDGYQNAFLAVGLAAIALILLALGLKSRAAELATVAGRPGDQETGRIVDR